MNSTMSYDSVKIHFINRWPLLPTSGRWVSHQWSTGGAKCTYYQELFLNTRSRLVAGVFLFVTLLLISFPIMIIISRLILRYDETTVETTTESRWFGFARETSTLVMTPAKRVLMLWGVMRLSCFMYIYLRFR